ncbi:MAG: hypothetical protein DA330_03850 [Nitrososphaera sp.]|nr:hypothetical protein [Nitrososphaera sp.]
MATATKEKKRSSATAVEISYEQISERAYQLWEARGCIHGYNEEDWFQAEKELLEKTENQEV